MKRETKNLKRKDGLEIDFTNCRKVMSSNLPLLFANGQPRSLETVSQPELEEFVPFMVCCSLGQEIVKKPKEINNCRAPEWWPQGFPFKFPLMDQTDWTNRLVMLKSLICRCYTFYNCEFLLKFSSELAEMSPTHLRFEENKGENTTSIYDPNGCMLVKCRNENLNYDLHKNHRRYLSPAHTARPASRKSGKRKTSVEQNEPTAKQRCLRRVFNDFPKEKPEPTVYTQEQYMEKFQLIPLGKEIRTDVLRVERKKRLAHSFNLLSVTSKRGQDLLVKNKHTFNVAACLERIDRFCGPGNQEDGESSQVYTRSAAVFSALYKQDDENKSEDEADNDKNSGDKTEEETKWCHTYKWRHRTNNAVYPHIGPALKSCSVVMKKLTQEEINRYYPKKAKQDISTMTPDEWCSSELEICKCQFISLTGQENPFFNMGLKYRHKKSSTRCTCGRSKSQDCPSADGKTSLSEVRMEANNEEMRESPTQDSSARARSRMASENACHWNGGYANTGSSIGRCGYQCCTITYSCCLPSEVPPSYIPSEVPPSYNRFLFRRPLAVVPPTPTVYRHTFSCFSVPEKPSQPISKLPPTPKYLSRTASFKINFSRSILDAIKWYTKDDPAPLLSDEFSMREDIKDPSQENIKPYTELILPKLVKPIDYFQQKLNVAEYEYCFKRTPDGTATQVSRRGEPCPSCFQGRHNFCVYEFVRQAKIAGLPLRENQKDLQSMFFKFITAVTKKS